MKKIIEKRGNKYCALFLVLTMLLSIGAFIFSNSLSKNELYFTELPTVGVVAKNGGNSDFYYADSVKSFEGEGFELLKFFAYFNETKERIDLRFSVKCTGDNEAFVREYGALYTEVEELQELKAISGNKLKKLVGGCTPHVVLQSGTLKGDTVDFYGSYNYTLGDRQFTLRTKHLKIIFELKEKIGYKTLKKVSKRLSFGNGINLYIGDGTYSGTTGVFALIESDGSTIPSEYINEKTDIKFIDSEGRQITKDIFPREEETEMLEKSKETPYYFDNISLSRLSAIKLTLSGTRVNKSAPIDLFSDTIFGNHFVYSGSYLRISDVKTVEDGVIFKAEALCDNELCRGGTLVFEVGFKENGKVPLITDLETEETKERITLCRADGEKEFKINLRHPEKLTECIIYGGVSLEYTAVSDI